MFYLTVDYGSSKNEKIFLDDNWGNKDIRGPYLTRSMGQLVGIDVVLSRLHPSALIITLALSNRCRIPALDVVVEVEAQSVAKQILRNGLTDFQFDGVFRNPKEVSRISVSIGEEHKNKCGADVLAMQSLVVERLE